jgi:hypothetical protein
MEQVVQHLPHLQWAAAADQEALLALRALLAALQAGLMVVAQALGESVEQTQKVA